ncbi:MAG: antitoxin [Candidatus Eremiobacteraeota bacterium]|nr:antitoxin [Candidatus Eremiobacteraeota bacterium]MCW5868503.1 antitoxin [Candidatus Eremiobacteraeota bacterium]
MKTTLELPDSLVRQIKLRAIQEGRKLKDMVAVLLQKGLEAPESGLTGQSALGYDERTQLPVVRCRLSRPLSPEQVAEILLEQEQAWQRDLS